MMNAQIESSHALDADPLLQSVRRSNSNVIRIGGVVLQSKLGEGGAGNVYLGWHSRLNIPVAVKVLKHSSPENLACFSQEGHLTACIDHPNLIRILDIDTDPVSGLSFMVMEYIKGCSAFEIQQRHQLRNRKPLTEVIAVDIAHCAATALGAVHRAGIVHRDVKSENILIRAGDGAVKLSDLGCASLQEQAGPAGLTVTGTTGFIALKILRGEMATPASDVYALGATLYELVAGMLPFGMPYDQTYFVRQASSLPRDPRQLNPTLSRELAEIIMKCLQNEPSKRYENGDDLAKALNVILKLLSGNTDIRVPEELTTMNPIDKRPVVLCVDDDENVLSVVQDCLEGAGFRTIGFTDPRHAIAELVRFSPDVAVVDFQMPGLDGVELVQRIRSTGGFEELGVLMLSGDSDLNVIQKALDAGVSDYLFKPLQLDELVVRVNLLAKLRAMNRERSIIETQILKLKKVSRVLSGIPACA